jgi:antitoxin (DNA-binding transcriptional repressor) of toxin-antitoxin stability system
MTCNVHVRVRIEPLMLEGVPRDRTAKSRSRRAPARWHERSKVGRSRWPRWLGGAPVVYRLKTYNGAMVAVTVSDIEQDLPGYLRRVEAGETVVVLRDGRPIAEIRPVGTEPQGPRPYGLCAGEFVVPDDFDAPLPDEIVAAFEGQ